jgi:tetratricopeptide (TPR) repeat protein
VAVFPFETVGLADTTLGDQLARITASYLEALPGLNVAPVRTTFREWRESRLPPADRLAQLSGGIGAKYGVWSIVRPAQGGVEAKLHVMDAGGHSLLETIVRGDPADPQGLGDSIVLQLVTKVFPGTEPIYRGGSGLSGRNPRAVREFLFGEDASERGAWLTAERHYQDALALDSTFLLAAWRLANVRRWMPWRRDPPLPVNFLRSYEAYGARLAAHERLLIDAQFAPAGKPRFELYEKALRRRPRDAYPALFYGDELFHRGPLSGRPRGDAIVTLQRAVELDSSLAPAHEHLAWALIRSGRKEEARRSLDALQRTAGHSGESEVHLPIFLELAYALRFAPDSSLLDHPALQSPTGLSLAARGALSVDLPELEAELGARLSKLRAAPRVLHGSGQIAQGLARMAQGRPGDAVAHFDSAISLVADSNEARLQSAEWRIVPAALGLPGIPSSETQAARRQLEGWTGDTAVILRAAWVLAMDALAQGDTLQAAPLIERVWALAGAGGPFAMQLSAMRSAAAGRLEEALRLSEPALAFDSAGRAGDPFFRSTLHLQRGHWYAALGRPNLADAAWLWYEALDLVGWPDGVAQAGEVDWALGTYARLARSRLTAGKPDRQSCALLAEVVANWRKPEPAYAPLVAEARRRLAQCPQ